MTAAPPGQSWSQYKQQAASYQQPVYGVNLGGWLVLEGWIAAGAPMYHNVPQQVRDGGEYALMQWAAQNNKLQDVQQQVQQFRRSFITEADIREIADLGLNTVRVPIGYWIKGYNVGKDQNMWKLFAPGAIEQLDQLINQWAPKHKVKVMICMHAPIQSQSGEQHSAPTVPKQKLWYRSRDYADDTVETLRYLAERYSKSSALWGFNLLNEPQGDSSHELAILKDYLVRAYKAIRQYSNCAMSYGLPWSQQLQPASEWQSFMTPRSGFYNMYMEAHCYYCFEPKADHNRQLQMLQNDVNKIRQHRSENPLLILEWGCAAFPESKYHHGVDMEEIMRAQLQGFSGTAGFAAWTWNLYGQPKRGLHGWSLQQLANSGKFNLSWFQPGRLATLPPASQPSGGPAAAPQQQQQLPASQNGGEKRGLFSKLRTWRQKHEL